MMKKPKTKEAILTFDIEKNQIDAVELDLYDWRDANLTLEKNGIQVVKDDIDQDVIKTLVENTETDKIGSVQSSVTKNQSYAVNFYKEVERTFVEKLNYFAACCRIYNYRGDEVSPLGSVPIGHVDFDNLAVDMFKTNFIDKNFARKNIEISEMYSRESSYLGLWKNLTDTPNSQAFCVSDIDSLTLDNYLNYTNHIPVKESLGVEISKKFELEEYAHEDFLNPDRLTDDAKYFISYNYRHPTNSVNFKDLLVKIGYGKYLREAVMGHITLYQHDSNAKWYIFDDLQEDESLIFTHFDFKRKAEGLTYATPHASTGRRNNFPERRSIDTRVVCFK